MYYNNLNRQQEDDDLKFIPLNIREPFLDKDSTWFPIIDMALPTFSEIPNSFASGFARNVDNSNLEGNSLKTLDLIQNNNLNLQSLGNNQGRNEFTNNFDLEYPSETISEELFSYNKEDECKPLNAPSNNMPQTNMPQTNIPQQNMPQINMPQTNMPQQNMLQPNMPQINMPQTNMPQTNMPQQNMLQPNMPQINMPQTNMPQTNMPQQNMSQPNISQQNMNTKNVNPQGMNMNGKNMGSTSTKKSRNDNQDELIHMNLLRTFNFEGYLNEGFRGEVGSQTEEIDRIFNIVKNDNSIMETFKAYNVPKPISDLIIKKIINIALENSKNKRGE